MKAFVGHSFDVKDEDLVNKFLSFLTKNGVLWDDGERTQSKDISEKIKQRILNNETFIGIFTIDQEIKQISSEKKGVARKSFWSKFRKNEEKEESKPLYTTSNWVIQESGYAIGVKRNIIFLVENGIYNFPELQGDTEYIPFDRASVETAYVKLLQMIIDIKQSAKPSGQVTAEEIPTESEEEESEEPKEQKGIPWDKMFEAKREGNIAEVERVYRDEIRENLKSENQTYWDALVCHLKYSSGDQSALEQLKKMAEDKKSYVVIRQLASSYFTVDKFDDARIQYAKCIEIADDIDKKLDCNLAIARTYSKERRYEDAIDVLLKIVNDEEYKEKQGSIFEALIGIAKVKDDNYLYVTFSEKALSINPVDTTIRFNLGLKYLNLGKYNLAVYHYKKLLDIQESSGTLNNLAVGYGNLDMKSKEANSLEEAVAKKDDTLPYANIAQKFLDEGFIGRAEALLTEADKLSAQEIEVHENIGKAKSRLRKIVEDEDKKEKELLDVAEKVHQFRVKHANAYSFKINEGKPSDISGDWDISGKWVVKIIKKPEANEYVGKLSYEEEIAPALGWLPSVLGRSTPDKKFKVIDVEIDIKIKNYSGYYDLKVMERNKDEEPKKQSARSILTSPLDSDKYKYSAKGLLVVNDKIDCIEVIEEHDKDKNQFLRWIKK